MPKCKPKAKPQAREWLFEGENKEEESDSGDDTFRMYAGQELSAFAGSTGSVSSVKAGCRMACRVA